MSKKSKFRKPYEHHGCAGHTCDPESLTEQHHESECNVNNIVKRYASSGSLFQTPDPELFVDLPDAFDYQSALNSVIAAESKFASVPASIRDRFNNDPAQFLAFMSDNKNYDAIVDLGLLPKRSPPNPAPAQPPNNAGPGPGPAVDVGRGGAGQPASPAPAPPPPTNQ